MMRLKNLSHAIKSNRTLITNNDHNVIFSIQAYCGVQELQEELSSFKHIRGCRIKPTKLLYNESSGMKNYRGSIKNKTYLGAQEWNLLDGAIMKPTERLQDEIYLLALELILPETLAWQPLSRVQYECSLQKWLSNETYQSQDKTIFPRCAS